MEFTLYLIGYGNQTPNKLFERLENTAKRWLVLDVRARRTSWCHSYRYDHLERALKARGHDYLWLYELGASNRDLVDENVGLMALDVQIERATRHGQQVVLLCAERSSRNCHRHVVAEKLRDRLTRAGHRLEIRPI